MDSPGCFRCGMHNAMLEHWDSERGEFKRVCRDCGYSHMSIELKEALRQVANYLWKLQKDVNEDSQEYRIESALIWARQNLKAGGLPLNPLAKRILRGFIEWRDFYPEGTDGFDEEFVYPIVAKTLMPRLLEEEEEVLSGGGGPEGTFYIALESIVENMMVRGPLTAKTSLSRAPAGRIRLLRAMRGESSPDEIMREIAMEEWAYVMWKETNKLWSQQLQEQRRDP